MINFATLQGLSIPEGVVTQITDASGRVIWAVSGGKVVLEVEKITSNTYAGETTYNNEQFILLDIYPKTNGTVKVTYGGLTKTITDTSGAEEPNAQQVFFGTFNGVSDSVTTPASGTLTIEGGFYAFGCSSFQTDSKATNVGYCGCVTSISDFGGMNDIASYTFRGCDKLVCQELPEGITSIGDYAFAMVGTSAAVTGGSGYNLTWKTAMEGGTLVLPSTIKSIGSYAFTSAKGLSNGSKTVYPTYFAKVKIRATTPPTLGTQPFGPDFTAGFANGSTVTNRVYSIEVPQGCGDIYKAADGWSYYANFIVEAS